MNHVKNKTVLILKLEYIKWMLLEIKNRVPLLLPTVDICIKVKCEQGLRLPYVYIGVLVQ